MGTRQGTGVDRMQDKRTKRLSAFLMAVVIVLAAADALTAAASPWWLRLAYSGDASPAWREFFSRYAGFPQPSPPGWFAVYGPVLVITCGVLCMGVLISGLRILCSIRRGEPFSPRNAGSLRAAALFSFGLAVLFMIKMALWPSLLTAVCAGVFMLFGLFMLVLSELFRQAARIREENELTI